MAFLLDPEKSWHRPGEDLQASRTELEARLGAVIEDVQVLSGGLSNSNYLIGGNRLLRVYRRDRKVLVKEAALLRMKWEKFLVPGIYRQGDDFLLMEYVPHSGLDDSEDQGARLGEALAEIHGNKYEVPGFLDAELRVAETMPDPVGSLRIHMEDRLKSPSAAGFAEFREPLLRFWDERSDALRKSAGPPVLLHGDYKVSNLHDTSRGKPLVLDWEFAWAGPALMDIGQLFRWEPSGLFREGFARAYRAGGGRLPGNWLETAGVLDLANLAGLIPNTYSGTQRDRDLKGRFMKTLGRD